MQNSNLIKSKKRVVENGEVFTSKREVNAMLDLVYDEALRVDSRFLEPACGDGNFLVKVLERKIIAVNSVYSKNLDDFNLYIFVAVSSLYGLDILNDNVEECRLRLLQKVIEQYRVLTKREPPNSLKSTLEFVLSKNIINGDALTLTLPNSSKPIIFSEWTLASGQRVKRIEYTFKNLMAYQPFTEGTLFSDLGEQAHLPHPLKKYPLIHYLKVNKYEE